MPSSQGSFLPLSLQQILRDKNEGEGEGDEGRQRKVRV